MFTKEDDRAIMHNLSFNRIADEMKTLGYQLKDYTNITRGAIASADKGSLAMRRLTRALVFVGVAQVVATIVSVFIK